MTLIYPKRYNLNIKTYSLKDHLKESLKDPKFKKMWEESEPTYQLSRALIRKRLSQKLSQGELAKKAHTTQAVISRLESMNTNPSIGLIQKIVSALNLKLKIQFE